MLKGIYPGSFDPITYGHIDIIKRAAKFVDHLTVGVLHNPAKHPLFSVEERVAMIRECIRELSNVSVEAFSGLSVMFAKEKQATVIVRGLRAVTDFEYELQMAQTNRVLSEGIDTLFLTTALDYAYLSSTNVREVACFKGDISKFVPPFVEKQIKEKYS
ncbi:MAG: pantetheine-phosphate adenylyltransferase [Lachnospiraceae bacterium]|nr:pantetheine-phosphate adenylyltransferase [Lachnospiraceae bacterium]MDY5741681.1 pantetheine-phosphate adenylyltransferase [Lachnospiraceae bacterium]